MKTIGYLLFALVYNLCRPFPIKKKKVLCIMTHDDGEASNVSLVVKELKKQSNQYTFSYITKTETQAVKGFLSLKRLFSFFFQKPYHIATAEYIMLDNIFLPFAYIRRKKQTKVIQLWHGTGTIKKFGQDVNIGKLKSLENRANQNITHLIANSLDMKKLYAGAFGVSEERIYAIGLPKTDELLQRIKCSKGQVINTDKEHIYKKYGIPIDKKLILYAPTFRDSEIKNPKVAGQLQELLQELPSDYCIGLRLHPHIAKAFNEKELDDKVYQLSFESDLNTILMATDLLITDYSSIIFDYCLTERPMIFYAYDLSEFSDQGRGFYMDYVSYVPGPVIYQGKELAEIIRDSAFDLKQIKAFKQTNYLYMDGEATKRLLRIFTY